MGENYYIIKMKTLKTQQEGKNTKYSLNRIMEKNKHLFNNATLTLTLDETLTLSKEGKKENKREKNSPWCSKILGCCNAPQNKACIQLSILLIIIKVHQHTVLL